MFSSLNLEPWMFDCVIERQGKELTIHIKNGPLFDGYVFFRGELVNIPFRPWYFVGRFSLKEWTIDEIVSLCHKKHAKVSE